jgi:chemotaxis protein MotB
VSYWEKRKKKVDMDSHVDDWLMTYADMITLLLCFFAVFVAISVPEAEKFEIAKEQVVTHFSGGDSKYLKGQYNLPETELDTPPQSDELFKALPSIVDRFDGQRDVEVERGDRITTLEMNAAPFFGKGSATLSPQGIAILQDLVPSLTSEEYKDYTISVEGYTDNIPMKSALFPSNWELSTARAAAVVRSLIDAGIAAERLRAVGYAEVSPKVANEDEAGTPLPDNQAQNRRVVIRLEKIEKAK